MNRYLALAFTSLVTMNVGVSSLTSMRKICPKLLRSGQVCVQLMNS